MYIEPLIIGIVPTDDIITANEKIHKLRLALKKLGKRLVATRRALKMQQRITEMYKHPLPSWSETTLELLTNEDS